MSGCGVFIIPDDLLADIFIRLPVKSIGKSRCVSKQWHSLLSSPRFIKAHLARSQKNMLIHNFISLYTFTLHHDGVAESTLKKLDGIPNLNENLILAGPCHGLILIVIGESCKLLMNPTTLEHSRLPELLNFGLGPANSRIGYGFGYDSSSEDYKVVALSSYKINKKHCNIFADIYSMKLNTWRRTDHFGPFVHPFRKAQFGNGEVFVNGALHWKARKKNMNSVFIDNVICALDLGTEKFHEIPYLGYLPGEHNFRGSLISTKGRLGIVAVNKVHDRFDIWTMNKYGMADSWTKTVFNVGDESWNAEPCYLSIPSCHRDALVIRHSCLSGPYVIKWMCYCFNDEKSFYLTVNKRNNKDLFYLLQRRGGFVYSESLVSPHHFNTQQHE